MTVLLLTTIYMLPHLPPTPLISCSIELRRSVLLWRCGVPSLCVVSGFLCFCIYVFLCFCVSLFLCFGVSAFLCLLCFCLSCRSVFCVSVFVCFRDSMFQCFLCFCVSVSVSVW